VARNSLLTGARTLVRFAVGIVLVPVLIDGLGAPRAGLFFFATTLTGYFTAVELSLATSLTKYIAEYRAKGTMRDLNSAVRGALLLMTLIGVAIALLLGALAVFGATSLFDDAAVRDQAAWAIGVSAIAALLYWPSRLGPAALEGLERYDLSALLNVAGAVATLVSVWLALQVTDSVGAIVAIVSGILIFQNLVAGLLALPHLPLARGGGAWLGAHLRPMLAFGGALFAIGIADTLVYSLDRTILAGFVGASAIVVYEIALRIQSGVRTISSLAGGALISTASRLAAQGRSQRLAELVLVGSFAGVVLTTPVAVLTIVLAEPLIGVWVGEEYAQHALYAQIFVSYWLVHSNTAVLGSVVTGLGRLRVFAALALAGGAVSLVLSVAMTAAWGTIGVILGTVIPAWIGLPIWMHYALRHVGIAPGEYLRAVVVPAYTLIAAWSAAVLAARALLQPSGLAGTGAFAAVALAAFWLLAYPATRARWRSVFAESQTG
jgi:O-antigen/teichoic acid export membrane protein